MRTVVVEAERLGRWLDGFVDRHGATTHGVANDLVTLRAADGAAAEIDVPFPPLVADDAQPYGGLVAHALAVRRVGVVLVRRGGFASGVFDGPDLIASKVGRRHVQGRSAAGGWSQQRFARRREGQAKVAYAAAADAACSVLLPVADSLEALVLGGDRRSCDAVLADGRLAQLLPLVVERRLDVPDPRRTVLEDTPRLFRAVRIRVSDPPPDRDEGRASTVR